jgi:hypothetical protein
MITGAGIQNYVQMPTYTFGGCLSPENSGQQPMYQQPQQMMYQQPIYQQPQQMMYGQPMYQQPQQMMYGQPMYQQPQPTYMDNRQPVMGGINLPVGNYSNPYMQSYSGGAYGSIAPPVGYSPIIGYSGYNNTILSAPHAPHLQAKLNAMAKLSADEASRRPRCPTEEDKIAISWGFDDAYDMQIQSTKMMSKIIKGGKSTQEEIDEETRRCDEMVEMLTKQQEEARDREKEMLRTYHYIPDTEKIECEIHTKVIKNDEVIYENDPTNPDVADKDKITSVTVYSATGLAKMERLFYYTRLAHDQWLVNMYENAPERLVDHVQLLDMFGPEGFGLIGMINKEREFNTQNLNSFKRTFDNSNRVKFDIIRSSADPLRKQRAIARMTPEEQKEYYRFVNARESNNTAEEVPSNNCISMYSNSPIMNHPILSNPILKDSVKVVQGPDGNPAICLTVPDEISIGALSDEEDLKYQRALDGFHKGMQKLQDM